MTHTLNSEAYASLLAQYQPKVITTDAENDQAIAFAEALEHQSHRTPEEEALLELLVTLIEKFEDSYHPIPDTDPRSTLLHLMEARELKQEALVGIIGSRGVVSEVLSGKRGISKSQAKALAEYFGVDAGLFI